MAENGTSDRSLHPVAVSSTTSPARFQPWPSDVKSRCFELWSSIGNRDAGRTEWLYSREVPADTAIPAGSTIRQWAREEHWAAQADADLATSHGRTLQELRTGWLAALQLSQATLLDAMAGRLDHLPYGGSGRVKAAEVTLRMIAQSGLLAVAPEPELPDEDLEHLSVRQQGAQMRRRIVRENQGR